MKRSVIVLVLLFLSVSGFAQEKNNSPKVSVLMFGDYFYNFSQRDAAKKDLNGFQFRRIFFTTDFALSESFDSRFRLEADQSPASLTAGGRLGVMVKDAYIKWKSVFQGSDFIFGLSPTPAFDVIEGAWGYRSVEKTIMDLAGYVPTRDIGIDLKGRLNNEGTINYWVKFGNNSVNGPETNKQKRFYGQVHFIPLKNFQFSLYGDYASYPDIVDAFDKQSKNHSTIIGSLFMNYMEKDKYSVGAESFYRADQNTYKVSDQTPLKNAKGLGLSVFGWVTVTDLVRLLARFDTIDPNVENHGNDKSNLLIGGVDFHINKNFSIIPNIETAFYQGASSKDVVGRVTFSYQYQ